jgi:group I intron endonuclease
MERMENKIMENKIYKVVNKINGKVYIGQTKYTLSHRETSHYYEAKYKKNDFVFHKALYKYGRKNFEWSILCKCKEGIVSNILEKFFIQKYESFYGTGKGYNMTPGGKGNSGERSLRTRQLLSEKGKRPQKEETKIKISEGLKQSYALGERDSHGMLGKKHKEETRKLMSKRAINNENGAKEWKVIFSGKEIIIKNIVKWCKENKYSYPKALWRIKHNIDLYRGVL